MPRKLKKTQIHLLNTWICISFQGLPFIQNIFVLWSVVKSSVGKHGSFQWSVETDKSGLKNIIPIISDTTDEKYDYKQHN